MSDPTNSNISDSIAKTSGAAKAVGGGLEAGSTEFGSSTAPMMGGKAGAGAGGASRTHTAGSIGGGSGAGDDDAGPTTGGGSSGAAGLSVTAMGRTMTSDARGGIGAAAVSGGGGGATDGDSVSQVSGTHQRTGAEIDTGAGTRGKGTAGTRARPADMTNDQATAPSLITPGRDEPRLNDENSPRSSADQLKQATVDARKAMNPGTDR